MDLKKAIAAFIFVLFIGSVFAVVTFNAPVPGGAQEELIDDGSIVYYLEALNAKIILQSQEAVAEKDRKEAELGKTESEVGKIVADSKGTVSTEQKEATNTGTAIKNTKWDNKATWANILSGENSTIIFPPVIADGKSQQLKLIFMPRGGDGIVNIDPFVNNKNADCYQGWGKFFNNWGGSTVVLGWGEGHETCIATRIENRYFLDVTLSSSGGYKQLAIISPLIPDKCAGKSFSQDIADNQSILKVTC